MKIYPGSKVLTTGQSSFFGSVRDPYEWYYRSGVRGITPTRSLDRRIYPKEFVLGLVIGGKAKAYPFSVLSRRPVINDQFEKVPLLVAFDKESATGMVFIRRVKGKVSSFKKTDVKGQEGLFLADDSTGSVWNGLTGRGVRGRLKAEKLKALPLTRSFWFGWVDHYPKTKIFLDKK